MTRITSVFRRGLLKGLLALCSVALVASFTMLVQAQNTGPQTPQPLPQLPDPTWVPANGTSLQYTVGANPPLVVVTVFGLAALNPASAQYRFTTSGGVPTSSWVSIVPPNITMQDSGFTAVMTVTPNVHGHGTTEKLNFFMNYVSSGNGSVTAAYPLVLSFRNYGPVVRSGTGQGNGLTPCTAISASPLANYVTTPNSTYKFFSLIVPTTSTLYLTATNVAAQGQLALRSPLLDNACSPTGSTSTIVFTPLATNTYINSAAIPIVPGVYYARIFASLTSAQPLNFMWSYAPIPAAPMPNDNPCQLPILNDSLLPNTLYWETASDAYDFFRIDVPTLSTVYLSVANFGASGQLQLRAANANFNQCSPTASTTVVADAAALAPGAGTVISYNVPAGTYYGRVNVDAGTMTSAAYGFTWTFAPGARPFEPNFTPCTAAQVAVGNTNSAYPDADQQWFYFDWPQSATIQVAFTNYIATGPGQYTLYQGGADCNSAMTVLDQQTATSGLVTLIGSAQPAGRYYLSVVTLSGFNTANLYSFRVSQSTVLRNPNVNVARPTALPTPAGVPHVRITPAP